MTRSNLLYLLTVFTLLLCLSCKKEPNNTIIQGVVFSNVENAPVKGVTVKFFKKDLSGNSFSNIFELLDEKVTDNLGQFNVGFLKTSSDIEYKFEFFKEQYGLETILISPEDLVTGESNEAIYNLVPTAILSFNIKSTSNTNPSDEILFNFNNDLDAGQSFINAIYSGVGVDELLTTQVIGERYHKYRYILRRNNQSLTIQDSVFISKGNTLTQEILY